MKAKLALRKIASRIHGRRATYPIHEAVAPDGTVIVRERPASRTCLRYDGWKRVYFLRTYVTCDADTSPANTREQPAIA